VLAANAASAQRSNTQHINGEGGERGLEYAGECAVKDIARHTSGSCRLPDGSARGVQQGLLDDSDAQRCPRMPDRWADAHQSHLWTGPGRQVDSEPARRRAQPPKLTRALWARAPLAALIHPPPS